MLHLNCIDTRYSVFLVSGGDVRSVVVTRGSLDTICYGHECASFTYVYSVCEEHIHRHSP